MAVAELRVLSTGSLPQWNGPGPRDVIQFNTEKKRSQAVGLFGKWEVEHAAWKLVSYLATLGPDWRDFTLLEAIAYYTAQGWDPNQIFYGLAGGWSDLDAVGRERVYHARPYLMLGSDARYAVTTLFVEQCMAYADR